MKRKQTKLIATFFYIGEFPFAPGTLASFAAALIYVIFAKHVFLYLVLTGLLTYLGFQASGPMEKILKKKDPGCVVIDEVAGMLIAFFLLPVNTAVFFTTFFLFRAFDMFKIYPCNVIEDKGGSTGIMMDDIVAGIYTNLVMQIALRWAGLM